MHENNGDTLHSISDPLHPESDLVSNYGTTTNNKQEQCICSETPN